MSSASVKAMKVAGIFGGIFMAAKCECGRFISSDKQYCVFCDPNVSDEQKAKWRKSGGESTRKIPHNLNPNDYRPLTPESLRRLYEDLISQLIDTHQNDLAGLVRELARILPRASEVVAYQNMSFLEERLSQLEARKSGRLLTPKVENYDTIEYSQQD